MVIMKMMIKLQKPVEEAKQEYATQQKGKIKQNFAKPTKYIQDNDNKERQRIKN